jgi:hypothetical protein
VVPTSGGQEYVNFGGTLMRSILPNQKVITRLSRIEDMISISTEGLRERMILGSKDNGEKSGGKSREAVRADGRPPGT